MQLRLGSILAHNLGFSQILIPTLHICSRQPVHLPEARESKSGSEGGGGGAARHGGGGGGATRGGSRRKARQLEVLGFFLQ